MGLPKRGWGLVGGCVCGCVGYKNVGHVFKVGNNKEDQENLNTHTHMHTRTHTQRREREREKERERENLVPLARKHVFENAGEY